MFKQGDLSSTQKNDSCFRQQVFVLTRENDTPCRFHFKANRKALCSSQKRY